MAIQNTDIVYSKSNLVINSKYKVKSILETHILNYALANIDEQTPVDENGRTVFTFDVAVLRKILGTASGSYYTQLKNVADTMMYRYIAIEDGKNFDYIQIINRARYDNGKFSLYFSADVRPLIINLNEKFTRLSLQDMLHFRNEFSVRVYEILKSRCYHPKGSPNHGNIYFIQFGLYELYFMIGVVDADNVNVKRILKQTSSDGSKPDYRKAFEATDQAKNLDYNRFHTRYLDPALKEINDKTDMTVTYEAIGSGRGGKVSTLSFTVECGEKKSAEEKLSELADEELADYIIEECASIGWRIKIREAMTICKVAENDKTRIYRAIRILEAQGSSVEDAASYLIAIIKRNYYPSKPQMQRLRDAGSIPGGHLREADADDNFEDIDESSFEQMDLFSFSKPEDEE